MSLSSADSDKCVVTLTLQPNAIIGRSTISPTTFSPQTTVVVSDSDCNSNSGSKASLSSPGTKLHRQICILFVDSVSQSHWLNQYHKHKSWACDHSTNKA